MSRLQKLLDRARRAPASLSFDDFVWLVESHGYEHKRTSGSHRIYQNEAGEFLNLQVDRSGKAKPYQVKQFLNILEGKP